MGRKIPMWQVLIVMLFVLIALCYCLGIFGMLFGDTFACEYGEVHIPLIASAIFAGILISPSARMLPGDFSWNIRIGSCLERIITAAMRTPAPRKSV